MDLLTTLFRKQDVVFKYMCFFSRNKIADKGALKMDIGGLCNSKKSTVQLESTFQLNISRDKTLYKAA